MSIEDDGCGFDPDRAAPAGGSHFGLESMRARAQELGGDLRIESAPDRGTLVVLEAPWPYPAKEVY